MKRKMIFLGLVLVFFISTLNGSVVAEDEELTFNDGAGDVFDEEFDKHPEVKDIDITTIDYTKTGKTLTLDINLADDIKKLSSIELVLIVYLYTSEQEYQILYLYSQLFENISASNLEGEFIDVDISGFNTNKLTLTFDLFNESEVYEDIIVSTAKADIAQTFAYTDIYPNEEFLDVDAGGDKEGDVGDSISFTATVSSGVPPYTYEWDFGDGEISEDQNPTHSYSDEGTYDVTLYVMDDDGIEGIDFLTVTIGEGNGNGNGNENGDNGDNGSSGVLVFVGLIVLIVIVIIAVLFFVFKK